MKHISVCIQEYLEEILVSRNDIPSVDEFNRKMHECIKYKKLIDLEKHLSETINWFPHHQLGDGIFELYDRVKLLMKDIPEESKTFDQESHGQTTN